jgi:FAD/FMN-containing dehydrogenase
MMRGIKRLLDPHDLFNPHRLLPAAATPADPQEHA